MTEDMRHSDAELSAEDLQAQEGQELPDREVPSLISENLAAPVDAAAAASALSQDVVGTENTGPDGEVGKTH